MCHILGNTQYSCQAQFQHADTASWTLSASLIARAHKTKRAEPKPRPLNLTRRSYSFSQTSVVGSLPCPFTPCTVIILPSADSVYVPEYIGLSFSFSTILNELADDFVSASVNPSGIVVPVGATGFPSILPSHFAFSAGMSQCNVSPSTFMDMVVGWKSAFELFHVPAIPLPVPPTRA